MNVLITGAAGFIGRHLAPKLTCAGYISQSTVDTVWERPLEQFVERRRGRSFDVVVHLAANIVNVDARMKMGMEVFKDIELDLAMCRWLEKNPPKKCAVLLSSCAVDFPDDPYCIVKRNLEAMALVLHKKGVPVVILRPFSGYGGDQSLEYPFPSILQRAMNREEPLVVWGSEQVRDWIHIDDLTDAIVYGISYFPKGVPIEVGTGIGTSIFQLAKLMAGEVGYAPVIMPDRTKPKSSNYRVARTTLNGYVAQRYGWEPKISLSEGIRRAVSERKSSK